MAKKAKNHNTIVSLLSYFLLGMLWYLIDKKVQNADTKFHLKQALNLFLIAIVLGAIFNALSLSAFNFLNFIENIINIVLFVLWIIGIVYAIQQSKKRIPIIGDLAEKYLTF